MSIKLVFLGSKPIGYECFSYLAAERENLGIEIAGLLTRHRKEFGGEHDLEQLAEANNIPVLKSLDDVPECDIIYSVQYHEILKQQHIAKAKQVAVNLHMAPLPEYRGANQFSYAIIEEKKEFGTTIHKIDRRIDHGDIMFQKRFAIPANCWVPELYEMTYAASISLFKETLRNIAQGSYTFTPQSGLEKIYGSSLHYRDEISALKRIDLSWEKEKIERHIRATLMPGFEPPYTVIGGKSVYFSVQAE